MTDEKKAEIEATNARIAASLRVVPADPSITLTPYSTMYTGVKYKANGGTGAHRSKEIYK